MKGLVLILSGPSGSGKSSLVNMLHKKLDNYYFSISTTTRDIRKNEADGKDYFFIEKEEFENDIKNNLFLEYAKVHNNYYGTSLTKVNKALNENKLVILDIDIQGQKQVIKKIGNICTSVFVTTPLKKDLLHRLKNRNTDTKEVIQKRIQTAQEEMPHIKNYEYLLVNDNLEKTFEQLMNIIKTMGNRVRKDTIDNFIKNWS